MYSLDDNREKLAAVKALLDHSESDTLFTSAQGRELLKLILKEVFPEEYSNALVKCLEQLSEGVDPKQAMEELEKDSVDSLMDDFNKGNVSRDDFRDFMEAVILASRKIKEEKK